MENKEVIIIGAGAAGVGMGVALKDFGINNFAILERKQVGNSFIKWYLSKQDLSLLLLQVMDLGCLI